MDDLEGVGNNTESKELLAVIAALHHQTNHPLKRPLSYNSFYGPVPVHQSLDNRHLSLLKLLLGVTTSGVREVYGMMDLDVVVEGDVFYLDPETRLNCVPEFRGILQDVPVSLPLSKELDLLAEPRDIFW
jgi:hypothetical protein